MILLTNSSSLSYTASSSSPLVLGIKISLILLLQGGSIFANLALKSSNQW